MTQNAPDMESAEERGSGRKRGRGVAALIAVVCFCLCFCLVFAVAQGLLVRKSVASGGSVNNVQNFWNEYRSMEPGTIDALYVGSSVTYCNIDPMYIYNESGLATYVLGCASMHYDEAYMTIKEALKTQHPKVVMLEASGFRYQDDGDESKYHLLTDQLPMLDPEKLGIVLENDWASASDLPGFVLPLLRYHDRWSEVSEQDVELLLNGTPMTYTRGHSFTFTQTEVAIDFYAQDSKWQPYQRSYTYLDKIVQLCQEEGIELVLFKTPAKRWCVTYSQAAQDYASANGLKFMEFYYELEQIGIDPSTDLRDDIGHMNQYGAEKFSSYLAHEVLPELGLQDHRSDEAFQRWSSEYDEYLAARQAVYDWSLENKDFVE